MSPTKIPNVLTEQYVVLIVNMNSSDKNDRICILNIKKEKKNQAVYQVKNLG